MGEPKKQLKPASLSAAKRMGVLVGVAPFVKKRGYIGGTSAQARKTYWNTDNEMYMLTDSVARTYGINPELLRARMDREGYTDTRIKELNEDYRNKTNNALLGEQLFKSKAMPYAAGNEFGLDDAGAYIKDGKVKLINENWSDGDFTNEKGRITNIAMGDKYSDNIGIMAATLKTMRDQAKKDFPKASDEDLDRYAGAYYNRGFAGGKKYVKSGGKGYNVKSKFENGGKVMSKPKRRSLEDTQGINVDTRSDTTRQGYHEGTIPYGAGNYAAGDSPLYLLNARVTGINNPYLITGEAPTPGVKKINSSWINAANDYIKTNKLSTFLGPNGKNYVKLPNGNVRSIEALGKEEWEKTIKGAVEAFKSYDTPTNVPSYSRNPTTNINATAGSIVKSKGKMSNRGAVRTEDVFKEGGSIHIAPSKRGTFTAAATKHGMGVKEFASRVLRNKEDFSTAMVKKANFARNASKWKH